SVVFQPIVETEAGSQRPQIHYLEGLVRSSLGSSSESAGVLFEYARRKRRSMALDRACASAVLAEAGKLPPSFRVGLNVQASSLMLDPDLPNDLWEAAALRGIAPKRLVLEIVDHAPAWEGRPFHEALERVRNVGARIALDDVGLGQSNYRMLLACRPDYMKV